MDIFAIATRKKLRFTTSKGLISVEDLWDLPLSADNGRPNLDDIARGLHKAIKDGEEVSFVVKKNTKKDSVFELAQTRFNIVKYIIDVKLNEAEEIKKAADTRKKNQRILELIAKKDDDELAGKSRDELLAMIQNENTED